MQQEMLSLEGLQLLTPRVFGDERGWFYEPWNQDTFAKLGITTPFLQDNHSRSIRNTLRGLHYQSTPGQAKLVRCTQGIIWDVAVDLRPQSSTFGKWQSVTLDANNKQMLFIPVGFAHGFCVLSDWAEVQYKTSNIYNAATECGIAWNDPDLQVAWPIEAPLLSVRDQSNVSFAQFQNSLKGE